MKLQNLALSFGVLALGAAAIGWSHKAPAASASPAPVAASEPSKAERDGWVNEEHTSLRAPVVTFLELRSENDGVLTFALRIEVRDALKFPAKLHARLPNKAELVEGNLEETIDVSSVGVQHREFKIRPGAISLSNPFVVTVEGESSKKVLGFHAERQFPARPEIHVPAYTGPRIPGGRPPAPRALPSKQVH